MTLAYYQMLHQLKFLEYLPLTVNCPAATTFESKATTAQTTTTITVDGSELFSLGSASFSGQVTITATGAVNLAGVTSAKALIYFWRQVLIFRFNCLN